MRRAGVGSFARGALLAAGWLLPAACCFGQTPAETLFAWSVQALDPGHLKVVLSPGSQSQGSAPAAKGGREFWALVAAQSAATVADIELTQWRQRQGWTEDNPFLPRRPSRPRMYAQFFAGNVAVDYAAWRLRRAGHKRWARAIQIGSIALYGYCLQHNLWHPGRNAPRKNGEL